MAWGGCATASREPPNLLPHKEQIRTYVESGQYQRDLGAVAARAIRWIEQRAATPGPNFAVVLDLDETLFFNWPHISAMDFGYVHREWERWVSEAKAPPIEPVREVYRTARRLGVKVIFITGRPERERASTERNLRAIDCGEYFALICAPDRTSESNAAYKTGARRKLASEGHVIIANVGDQASDLAGGFAERTFKLPNAFYRSE